MSNKTRFKVVKRKTNMWQLKNIQYTKIKPKRNKMERTFTNKQRQAKRRPQ